MATETADTRTHEAGRRPEALISGALVAGLSFVGGLATGRLIFEWQFPALAWLGRPLPGLLFAAATAVIGLLLWQALGRRLPNRAAARWQALLPFLPLIINLGHLPDPAVNLARGRLLFLAGLWLALLLLARLLVRADRWRWLAYVSILLFLLPIYLATMGRTVGMADTFEFQVVVPQSGIVHPTGYPLYLLLARPFTWLPFGSVAWQVNLATLLFALAAVGLLYTVLRRWSGRIVPSVLAAVVFGLTPTFWSQAIEAEVYSLHALVVAGALLLMREIGGWGLAIGDRGSGSGGPSVVANGRPVFRLTVSLALVLGLGLTNHLTTVILLPVAAMASLLAYRQGRYQGANSSLPRSILLIGGAFLLPLLLYAYLPIRWAAVNGEAMGWRRFVDWVIGGRFQGALQLTAWLRDGARYDIVGRLLVDQWPIAWGLPLIVLGLLYAGYRSWRFGLILAVAWLGYAFYALNYYVPDLAVFLIPAYLIMAVFWAAGLVGLLHMAGRLTRAGSRFSGLVEASLMLLAIAPALLSAGQSWATLDRSSGDGRTRWGRAVLDLPLAQDAAILADSAKFPPLYYLQQVEGLQPDLDIVVLPDEATYRSELDQRLAAGQAVYLARFLPGLESIYHLRSLGPLVEVSRSPMTAAPAVSAPLAGDFGPIRLLGYRLATESPFAAGESAVTFYWQAAEPLDEVLQVYTRWAGDSYVGPASSQHPAGNTYPTVAWRAGEIVADYHALPRPILAAPAALGLEVALAPPFAPPEDLAWQPVAMVEWGVGNGDLAGAKPLRMLLGPFSLDEVAISEPVRGQTPLVVRLSGYAEAPAALRLAVVPDGGDPAAADWQLVEPAVVTGQASDEAGPVRLRWTGLLPADFPSGSYQVLANYAGQQATCTWLAEPTDYCLLGRVALSDALLPPDAARFEDNIALLSVDVPDKQLAPGGQLALTLTWQALAEMDKDYTVFVQVLDQNDRIVGQVDAWPQQGTYPTSSWAPGEIVEDPYLVQLDPDLAPGQYKLYLGWYLLETLRRLPVLDQDGRAVDDKVAVPGLVVPE